MALEAGMACPQWPDEIDLSPEQLLARREPVVLRGIAADWPAVTAAKGGSADAAAYLQRFDRGEIVDACVGVPAMGGRYFHNENLSGFNFQRGGVPLSQLLASLSAPPGGSDVLGLSRLATRGTGPAGL